MKIKKKPKVCNICGGKVVLAKSTMKYGSGYRYLCTKCSAYIGTYDKDNKDIAYGILADKEMQLYKRHCRAKFNLQWRGCTRIMTKKQALKNLSKALHVRQKNCYFEMFDIATLKKAFDYLRLASNTEAESEDNR